MQPRTRVQKNVVKLSKQLRNPSEKQKAYAFKHCFTHFGYRSKRGVISCLECGYQWAGEHQLEELISGIVCPKCEQQLKVVDTRNRTCREKAYFTILSTCEGYQILRHFLVKMFCKVKHPAQYSISEVVQQWIDSKGKIINIGRKRCMSAYYYDVWNMYSDMEIRQNNQWGVYDINPFEIYPRKRVIPLLKRNGFTGDFYNLTPVSFLSAILRM